MSLINRPWAFWRRVQYGLGFSFLLTLAMGVLFLLFFSAPPSCFDGVQNGNEEAPDCGGACVRICNASVFPPKIVWAESFEIITGQYNAVAYIENVNTKAATKKLRYTFSLYNGGQKVTERSGETILPPNSTYPIFEGRIDTFGQTITATEITLEPIEIWQPASVGREQFSVADISLSGADARPRLDATVENTTLLPAKNVEVVTTLFNVAGDPLTASETYVEEIAARTKEDIVFTWPRSIAKTVRSCTIPSDVVLAIDLSGSMNNDGDTPPQPISAAKIAAENFVKRLSNQDQVGLVTFATDAQTVSGLTSDRVGVAEKIKSLVITPESETGFTNTVDALRAVQTELSSVRHSDDARKAAVFLTDGLPTGQKETEELIAEAVAIAKEIQNQGVVLYAIGLGQNVDRAFIRNLVEDDEFAYFAPSGSNLDAIYATITGDLCESGTTRIDIIPKTSTNFVPLR